MSCQDLFAFFTSEQVTALVNRNAQLEKELHHSQAKLSEYENLFRQFDRNFQSVFWLVEQETREILFISSAFETIWQRPRTSAMKDMASLWQSTILPEDWTHVEAIYAALPKNNFEVTYRIRRPDGSIRWIRDRGFPVYNNQGEAYRIAGTGEDITEQKQAEVLLQLMNQDLERRVQERTNELEHSQYQLRQRELEFRTLVEHSPDIITRRDRSLRFLYVNPAIEKLGLPCSAYIGKTLEEIGVASEECRRCHTAARQAMESGKPQISYSKATSATGVAYFQTLLVPEFDQAGSVSSVLTVMRDVSSLKQAEEAVRRNEERFRRVFEDSPLGMGIATMSGHFLMVNERLCQIVGYSCAELLPLTFWDITHPEDYYKEFEILQQAMQTDEKIMSLEKRFIRKDKQVIWVRITVSLVHNEAGELLHQIGMIEDISDRKQAEVELRASLQDKEILLKEIHHRVKNNLQTVSSLLNLQASYIEDAEILAPFTESQNRVEAMALLHERLYQSDSLAKVNFSDYIRKLSLNLIQSYEFRDRSVGLEFDVADIEMEIDTAIPCGLIVNELVSNALKHAFPQGRTGKIRVSLTHTDARCILSIADNGIGIPEDVTFYNTDSLGLQLVSGFANKLQGEVNLDRSEGSKVTISFKIPQSL